MSVTPWNDEMQHAIAELEARIRAVYPEATFRLIEGEDPMGFSSMHTPTPRMPLRCLISSVTGSWILA
jgi:hypothetical protein